MKQGRGPARWLIILVLAGVVAASAVAWAEPPVTAAPETPRDVTSMLDDLDVESRRILGELFTLSRRVEEHRVRLAGLVREADRLRQEVRELEQEVEASRRSYQQARESAAAGIRMIQRLGPASYLDLVLGSGSTRELLDRIAVVLSMVRGMNQALGHLQVEYVTLTDLLHRLQARQAEIEAAKQVEIEAIERLEAAVTGLEDALAALGEQRAFFEQRLGEVEEAWALGTSPVIEEMIGAFNRLLAAGVAPPGTRLALSLTGMRLLVPIAGINETMSTVPELHGASFSLDGDELRLEVPDALLIITGDFDVRPPADLLFVVREVRFLDWPVSDETMALLFPEGELAADLSPVLEGFSLHSVRIRQTDLEFGLRQRR